MIVYSNKVSERLIYILEYVLVERLGINFTIETDLDKFNEEEGFKLNYSQSNIDQVFQVIPHDLLFENNVNDNKPEVAFSHKTIHLYSNDIGNVPFDVFSACFWMISRYEEYQTFTPDEHNRFRAKFSLAYLHGFVKRPIVDEWVLEFKEKLGEFYPNLRIKDEKYKVIPTIDVDSPWCYKNKGIARNLGGILRDFFKKQWSDIPTRLKVLTGIKEDSHYQFGWLKDLFFQLGLKPMFFVLVGKFSKYDKTVNPNKHDFKLFVNELLEIGEVNIHPSYRASERLAVLKDELAIMETLADRLLTKSRQHFLKIELPGYYEKLVNVGLTDDYSFGYADLIGFRAGTSRSFKFYNLTTEQVMDVRIHPFSVMDVTLNQYQKLNTENAIIEVSELIGTLKQVNGNFVTLWHNESLSNEKEWIGWKEFYVDMLKLAL